jgi:hypothetical protein
VGGMARQAMQQQRGGHASTVAQLPLLHMLACTFACEGCRASTAGGRLEEGRRATGASLEPWQLQQTGKSGPQMRLVKVRVVLGECYPAL